MAWVRKLVGWALALALVLAFPWLALPAAAYLAWKHGIIGRAIRIAHGWTGSWDLGEKAASLDAAVSQGLSSEEAVINYEAPCEGAQYVVVQRGGERRVLVASLLKERVGSREDFGRVFAKVMAEVGGLSWSATFALFLSEGKEVGGLIALHRSVGSGWGDPETINREAVGLSTSVEKAVASVAPSISVRKLRGKELAPLALWRDVG